MGNPNNMTGPFGRPGGMRPGMGGPGGMGRPGGMGGPGGFRPGMRPGGRPGGFRPRPPMGNQQGKTFK